MAELRRFLVRQLAFLLPLGAALFALEHYTDVDFMLARLFYSPELGAFPLKSLPLLSFWGHEVARDAVIVFSLCLAYRAWRTRDARLGVTVLAMALASLAVSSLKAASAHSCPWELSAFGGDAAFFRLLDAVPLFAGSGRCFPGGHASGGFTLMALYFYWRGSHPARARFALAAGLVAGGLMGLVQMARGAHFLSHNLFSAYVVWCVVVAVFAVYEGWCLQRAAAAARRRQEIQIA